MKFLIYGNAPFVGTGYGIQIGHLVTRLKRDGHDVAVACTYGHQVGIRQWPTPYGPVTLYPSGYLQNSEDVLMAHAMHWFDSDPKAGWIISITDQWVLRNLPLDNFQVIAWTPVDHFPCPPQVIEMLHRTGARPVAMSQFGQRMLIESGLNPDYIPLAVDTTVFKPTAKVTADGVEREGRDLFHIPADAWAVLMVAMNKDPQDRKGFNEAFRAFGQFWRTHQEAVLVVHTAKDGSAGSLLDLEVLARHAAIPPHALIFTDQYAQRIGFTEHMLAGLYSACDVLLAPSHGEGFGVPLIEAQACGLPVIVSDFSSQPELVGDGWIVDGQLSFDLHQQASYIVPYTVDVFNKLELAYGAPRTPEKGQVFAGGYDVDVVWEKHWRPLLESLEPRKPKADKPRMESVDVIVPLMREENRLRFYDSLAATSEFVPTFVGEEGKTYAENVNGCLGRTLSDWVLVVGDDVEFTPGWFEAAQALSDTYDVIGTNDSEEARIRNPKVAAGTHADHFFVRRSYIDEWGACLDGPGVLAPEAYGHWYTDVEIIELAKARGVYGHAHDCRIIHHHPGYEGDEAAREADPLYVKATETAEADRKTWMSRLPLVQAQRVA